MMKKSTLIALSCVALLGAVSNVEATIVSSFDSVTRIGGNNATDLGLTTQVSNIDVLEGITPTISNLWFNAERITDGLAGEQDFSPDGRVGLNSGDNTSVIEFTSLTPFDLGEIRVYSYNSDDRAVQVYDLAIDTGSGFGATIISVNGGVTDSSNVSSITNDAAAAIASGVVGIRFTVPDLAGTSSGYTWIEIDAFAVPEPSSFILASLGVAGMGLASRRRRRRKA